MPAKSPKKLITTRVVAPAPIPATMTLAAAVLVHRIASMATPGFVISLVVLLLSLTAAPGVNSTVHDLWGHVLHIHPFVAALAGVAVSGAVLYQGADFGEVFDDWFGLPVLEFLSHVFAVALGALLPLAPVSHGPWAAGTCGTLVGIAGLFGFLAFMAAVATSGLIIVEARVEGRLPPRLIQKGVQPAPALKASTVQLGLFAGLLLGSLVVAFYVASLRLPTEELIGAAANLLSGSLGCGASR